MSMPWFRMYAEFAGDPVIQSLAFEDQRHYIILLCLKCNGTLDRDIADIQRERIVLRGLGLDPVAAAEAKRRLMEVGLVDTAWQPKGWDKRQYLSDISTDRVRKFRNNKETGNVSETKHETDQSRYRTEQNRTEQIKPEAGVDISTEMPPPVPPGDSKNGIPYTAIVAMYHELLPELPKVAKLTQTRKGYLRQRWNEDLPSLEAWREYFTIVRKSKFLMGQSQGTKGRPPFRADLEWLCRPNNITKVIEGKYHHG